MTCRSAAFYSLSFFFIFCWWMIAYKNHEADEPKSQISFGNENARTLEIRDTLIEIVPRDTLIKALQGDIALMSGLILKWDLDAQILQHDGFENIKRLKTAQYIESQKLARIQHLDETSLGKKIVIDDMGVPFDLAIKRERFLPQTFMAAEILLALKPSSAIAALPNGFECTSAIPLVCNRYASEALAIAKPDIAFVSKRFSDHAIIDLLKAQGVPLFFVREVDAIEDLNQALLDIADISGEPLKGRVLSTFIEALFMNLDNIRVYQGLAFDHKKICALSYYNRFFMPGKDTLTYQFLKRMGIDNLAILEPDDPRQSHFSIPISEEEIAYFDPDLLIILTDNQEEIEALIQNKAFLKKTSAEQAYISEKMQLSLSQLLGLAYYDLTLAVMKLK